MSSQADDKLEGFIITTFDEIGPVPVIALTSLDEMLIAKLSIVGMTLVSMGSSRSDEQPYYRLHGPIPVPDTTEYEAFSMTFNVEAPSSSDVRVVQSGKLSNVWLIFHSSHRDELVTLHGTIERVLASEIKDIKHENELNDQENMKRIFDRLQELIRNAIPSVPATGEPLPRVEQVEAVQFYTVNQQGDLLTITSDDQVDLATYPLLVIVNTVLKQIFVLKNSEDIPRRLVFLASRAASNLNARQWKNKFLVQVYDAYESMMLLEQASTLFKA